MSVVIFLLLRLAPGNIVDILFATGGFALVAAAAAVLWTRRRQRRTLIPKLDPQGGN